MDDYTVIYVTPSVETYVSLRANTGLYSKTL